MKRDYKLKNITRIRFGLNAKTTDAGSISCIQGKDFDADLQLTPHTVYKLSSQNFNPKDILQKDEIIFSGKGSRNYAVVWNNQIKEAVASSTFFILTIIDKIISPEYLAWYLNSEKAKSYFKPFFIGVTIPNITKKVLEDMDVAIPDLSTQKLIISTDKLIKEEAQLLQSIASKKEKVISQLLLNKISN